MATPQKNAPSIVPSKKEPTKSETTEKELIKKFDSRATKELVIAFAGPIGCGMRALVNDFKSQLINNGYDDVVSIKLSRCLTELIDDGKIKTTGQDINDKSHGFQKYRTLQNAGNKLREVTRNPAILAEYAMKEIGVDREKRKGAAEEETIVPGKVAYLIDQVKRPEEVALLRAVYRNAFFLVGVTRSYSKRVDALRKEIAKTDEIHNLMEIDRAESISDGQRIDKTLHLSDYFIGNDAATFDDRSRKINRLLELIHGNQSITPTIIEQGMYAAHAAGLRSACLSRQVGAAIISREGELLATGCNDVPKPGGGLYFESYPEVDMRCVHREDQHCFNDFHKKQLRDEIGEEVGTYLGSLHRKEKIELSDSEKIRLIDYIYENTKLKDLIEFSRAVHAEMDAIISIGRQGVKGLINSTLFTTTFPCHNCARHIIAAGIKSVIYIEPYEKSMARNLHDDAIVFDSEKISEADKKTYFIHFEGVSPRKFSNFFQAGSRKNKDGTVLRIHVRDAKKSLPEYLDNYQGFEAKAAAHFQEGLSALQSHSGPVESVDS